MALTPKAPPAHPETKPVDLPHMPSKPEEPTHAPEPKADDSLLSDGTKEEMEAGRRGIAEVGDRTKEEMALGKKIVERFAKAKPSTPESEDKHTSHSKE